LVEENSEAKDEAMVPESEIETPTKVQKLQRTLYRKAKEDGRWRAWSLYGDLCRHDVLETALCAVVRNAGAAGVDGVTTQQVKATAAAILEGLQTQLRTRSYRPSPVLRVWIPKPDGKQRPLGIPTVKDRIVQMALLILLQPIFEADFHEDSYGYRPGRNAHQALDAIRAAIWKGKYEIIDADLSGYFDTIAHAGLLRLVARRVSDGSILALVKAFLKAPIVEEKSGRKTIQPNERGTPQGGVISPLLANLYLNSLDHGVNDQPELDAKLVRYADDFVLLCRPGDGAALQQRLKSYLQRKGLKLNETKTRVLDVRHESFRFLSFEVSWRKSRTTGKHYPHVEPSKKARQKLRDAVRRELNHWTTGRSVTETIRTVNQVVRGWSHYFHYGHCTRTYVGMQDWMRQRYRTWLWKKYGRTLGYYTFFTNDRLQGQYQLFTLPSYAPRRR
jgi:group II intron reverse transcriptase/maturase